MSKDRKSGRQAMEQAEPRDDRKKAPTHVKVTYFDKFGRPTDQKHAIQIVVTEYDENGEVLHSFLAARAQTE